jgi:hypothetical protein
MNDVPDRFSHPDPPLILELLAFLREEKAWWLAPLVLSLSLLSALLLFAEGSALSPMLYVLW